MNRSRCWWLAGVAALTLVAAGCGEGDVKRDATSAPTSDGRSAAGLASAPSAGDAARAPEAAPGSSGGATAQAANQALPPLVDRKLIFNVSLDLTVKDVQSGFERIAQIADANGGLVAESSVRQEGDQRRATITIRVPSDRYLEVLGQIRGLAVKVETERSTANDVTEEFTDLQSRQRNLEATEQQLLVFLGQAKTIQEVLQVQDRLTSTRAEIEKIKGRINLLTRLTDLATIQAHLRPEAPVAKAPDKDTRPLEALRAGWTASLDVLSGVAVVALTVAAFSWWLLPFALLGLWLLRREQRRRAVPPQVPTGPGAAP